MKKYFWLFGFTTLLLLEVRSVVASDQGSVRQLTDENFEHDTQAATGATTGDWLVEFYSAGCNKCKAVKPAFQDLAQSMQQQMMFGAVDVTANPRLVRRFGVERLPFFVLFSKGKMYPLNDEATSATLKAFASGGFKSTEGVAVPAEITILDDITLQLKEWMRKIMGLYEEAPNAVFGGFFIGLSVGIIMMLMITMICSRSSSSSGPGTSRRSKARKKD